MSVLIRGVRPYGEGERVDVLVDDGQIAQIGPDLAIPDTADVIDATGHVLLPGFVDLHTHLREPGREYAEDIETGSAAAALGGYTAVFAMANTNPVAEPYVDIAARMTTAVDKARVRGAGHEVVCVSHQLPVWTLRLYLTGKRLWHDPRRRDCALASVTSLIYDGDRLVDVVYSQPAAL